MLELSSLRKAICSLRQAITDSRDPQFLQHLTDSQLQLVKAGVIQNFEFSYELCYKIIKRKLEQMSSVPREVDQMTFNALIRHACEAELLTSPEEWFFFRQQRNITSHTYDIDKADEVYQTAIKFCAVAEALLDNLEQRHD